MICFKVLTGRVAFEESQENKDTKEAIAYFHQQKYVRSLTESSNDPINRQVYHSSAGLSARWILHFRQVDSSDIEAGIFRAFPPGNYVLILYQSHTSPDVCSQGNN